MRSDARGGWRRAVPVVVWLAAATGVAVVELKGAVSPIAPGAAQAIERVVPSPRVARIASVDVAVGDPVEAGEVVARLESPILEAEIAVARAEFERMRDEVGARAASLREASRLATARLSNDAESAAFDVSRVEVTLRRDQAELEGLREQIARQKKLVDQQLVPAQRLDELNVQMRALRRKVEAASRALAQAKQHATAGAKRVGENGDAPGEPTHGDLDSRLAPLRTAVRVQEARIDMLVQMRAELTLRAPARGRVSAIWLRAGAIAAEGQPVVTVVDDRPTRVVAYADQMWSGRVKLGDIAELRASDGATRRRRGRVVAVAPQIAELPVRFRQIPSQPAFGRAIHVELDPEPESEPGLDGVRPPLPGQAFDVVFEAATPASKTPEARR